MYYGGLQNYKGLIFFDPRRASYHNSVCVCRHYKIFDEEGIASKSTESNKSKIYKDHKQETVRLRTLPLVALKGFAGRKEFLVMENVKRSGIFFTPQSEVRQHLSQ